MKWLKRIMSIVVLMAVMTLESGCWDMVEINDRLCIRGVGLDQGEEQGMLKVTFQMLTPYESSDTQGKPAYQTLTVEASTISEAVAHLAANVEQQIHFEHLSAIVLGSSLAQQDPLTILDYFHRTSQVRRNAEVVAVNGEAQKLLTASVAGGGVGEYVENLIKTHETENALAVQPSALSRLFVYRANHESFYLPVLDYQPSKEQNASTQGKSDGGDAEESSGGSGSSGAAGKSSEAQNLKLAGGFLYDGSRFAGVMDINQLELLRLLQGKQEHITLTLSGTDTMQGRMSFRVERIRTHMDCRVKADHFEFPVTVEAECIFQEVLGGEMNAGESIYREMELALEEHIVRLVQELISNTRDADADVMGFERMVRQRRYPWYRLHGDEWDEYFKAADIPVTVHVTLRRGGYLQ